MRAEDQGMSKVNPHNPTRIRLRTESPLVVSIMLQVNLKKGSDSLSVIGYSLTRKWSRDFPLHLSITIHPPPPSFVLWEHGSRLLNLVCRQRKAMVQIHNSSELDG